MPISNEMIVKHLEPRLRRSIWQLVNTLLPYAALMSLMAWTAPRSLWVTLALAVPGGALLVRIFVLFHDCAHGSLSDRPGPTMCGALSREYWCLLPFEIGATSTYCITRARAIWIGAAKETFGR